MGHFFNYDPKKFNQETAEELQPAVKKNKTNLISPEEWTYCEKEKELTSFSRRNNPDNQG